ncbi:MAG: general secretion pathway protein GspD [Dechloromonas sp.]|nr:general secretion pathway protein GspD [Dechloromonas sp.]
MKLRHLKTLSTYLCFMLIGGCFGGAHYSEGRDLVEAGNLEAAVPKLRKAADDSPWNVQYQATYLQTRERMVNGLIDRAMIAKRNGEYAEAEGAYRRLLALEPDNTRAKDGLQGLVRDNRHQALMAEADAAHKKQDFETAQAKVRAVLQDNPEHAKALALKKVLDDVFEAQLIQPQLSAALRKPITIEFREAPLRQIFEVLSRSAGLNFVFDKEVKGEQRTTIFLRNSSIQNAINLILLTNQLEQRVLDANSILIYPNTASKQKDYQALVVKTFFLSNADIKTAEKTLKNIVRAKDVVIDEKQNMIIMRDTPDAIRLAEKLLTLQDLQEPEIMLEVAILEISRSRLIKAGIQLPNQLSLAPLGNGSGAVTLSDLRNLTSSTISASLAPLTINADQEDGDVKMLANPRIRARNREVAKIMIGDRIPNITSTATATGFVSENIQYVDIGLKLEVQPMVYADNEVAIKISLEVSSIVKPVQTKSGSLAYQIGTRNASTLLKLKDGENQVLAGLIRNDEAISGSGFPLLSDIPLLGRLFGTRTNDNSKSEVVLSITPRLIRGSKRADLSSMEIDTGTEASLKLRSLENGAQSNSVNLNTGTAPSVNLDRAVTNAGEAINAPQNPGINTAVQSRLTWIGMQPMKVGGTLTLQLSANPGEPITGVPLALGYDPKMVEVVSITEGDFLKQGGGTTSFSSRIDKASGQVFATVTRTAAGGATSPGTIANVTLRALAPTQDSKLRVTAVAPIGMGGRAIDTVSPQPLSLSITP